MSFPRKRESRVAHFDHLSLSWDGYEGRVVGGKDYVPIARRFLRAHATLSPVSNRKTILVTMGGADPNQLTLLVMEALKDLEPVVQVNVVMGFSFSFKDVVYRRNEAYNGRFEIIEDAADMEKLMADAGLAISALGTTIYELGYMGVPTIIISNYREDRTDELGLGKFGSIVTLGYYRELSAEGIRGPVESIWADTDRRITMSRLASKVIDGLGARRICEEIRGGNCLAVRNNG